MMTGILKATPESYCKDLAMSVKWDYFVKLWIHTFGGISSSRLILLTLYSVDGSEEWRIVVNRAIAIRPVKVHGTSVGPSHSFGGCGGWKDGAVERLYQHYFWLVC